MNTPQNCPHPEFAVIDGRCTHCGKHILAAYDVVLTNVQTYLAKHTDWNPLAPNGPKIYHVGSNRNLIGIPRPVKGLAILSVNSNAEMIEQLHLKGFEVVLLIGNGARFSWSGARWEPNLAVKALKGFNMYRISV